MAGRIPKQFIDDLLTRIDIVDVIDARVPLKKAGANHIACCPFHNEKTPSFTVSQSKQFYHCFGCGAHGTAIGFLIEYDRMEFPEAIESLAQTMGLEVPREGGATETTRDYSAIYNVLEQATSFYKQELKKTPPAIDYLKSRGLSGKTAVDFDIGFAGPAWDGLIKHLSAADNPVVQSALKTAGLANERDSGGLYDRFRNRIVFPINDRRGRVIGFGGRVIDPKEEPKYLNSPETPVFHKGNELYGLYRARKLNNKLDYLLIVEGYMDVVMLAEHGINQAVATLGTATTEDHLRNLFKATNELAFCFDGDDAGHKAAWRAFETSLPVIQDRHQIKFLFLPDGEDPDSLIQKESKENFLTRISNAQTLTEYLMSQLLHRFDGNSLDGRAQMADFVRPMLQKINAEMLKELLAESLGKQIGLPASKLLGTATGRSNKVNYTQREQIKRPVTTRQRKLEMDDIRFAVAALIANPKLAKLSDDITLLSQLRKPGIALLFEIIQLAQAEPNLTTAHILERFREREEFHALNKLASYQFPNADDDPNLLQTVFLDALSQLQRKAKEQRYSELIEKGSNSTSALSEDERVELQSLMEK